MILIIKNCGDFCHEKDNFIRTFEWSCKARVDEFSSSLHSARFFRYALVVELQLRV